MLACVNMRGLPVNLFLVLPLPPRHVRESSFAKVSLGTLPQLDVAAVNNKRDVIARFKKTLRARCHASIYDCFVRYNARGGTVVPLQYGGSMYFPRACILAIYADHPAAVECTTTGSACPVCYTRKKRMAAPLHSSTELRTDANMTRHRSTLKRYAAREQAGNSGRALKRSKQIGVSLGELSVWSVTSAAERCEIMTPGGVLKATSADWVFGPDAQKDNVYQNVPQVGKHFRCCAFT